MIGDVSADRMEWMNVLRHSSNLLKATHRVIPINTLASDWTFLQYSAFVYDGMGKRAPLNVPQSTHDRAEKCMRFPFVS